MDSRIYKPKLDKSAFIAPTVGMIVKTAGSFLFFLIITLVFLKVVRDFLDRGYKRSISRMEGSSSGWKGFRREHKRI
jgi:hypothetical protein